jgi:hypothetical protein
MTQATCRRCGMAAEAAIHTGDHPTNCHTFEPRNRLQPARVERVAASTSDTAAPVGGMRTMTTQKTSPGGRALGKPR